MSAISEFWLSLLEVICLPVFDFFGYNNFLGFVILVFFVGMQIWVFWHFFAKPIIYVCKFMIDIINSNWLWESVEVDEKSSKKTH